MDEGQVFFNRNKFLPIVYDDKSLWATNDLVRTKDTQDNFFPKSHLWCLIF